jgi:hypothetical protein
MRISVLVVFVAISLLLTTPGCVKWYCCSYDTSQYKCTKPTDTVYLLVYAAPDDIQAEVVDSLNKYRANGYTCTLLDSGTQLACTKGAMQKRKAEKAGEVCSIASDDGCSISGDCVE